MRARAVVLVVLASLTASIAPPILAGAAGPALTLIAFSAPSWAWGPAAGDDATLPLAVGIAIHGPPGALVQVRAGFTLDGAWASRTWTTLLEESPDASWATGKWQRSDWRVPAVTLDAHGAWRGHVAVAPNPDATHAARVLGGATTRLLLEAHPARGAPASLALPLPLLPAGAPVARAAAPDAPLARATVEGQGEVVVPVGIPGARYPGLVAVPLPSARGAQLDAGAPLPVPAAEGLRLLRETARTWLLANLALEARPLAGLCVRAAAGGAEGCFTRGALAVGGTLRLNASATGGASFRWGKAPLLGAELVVVDGWGEVAPRQESPERRAAIASAGAHVYTTPHGALATALGFLAGAHRTLDVAGYTFGSAALAQALAEAHARGVRVRVLVDGSPAGGVSEGERAALAHLQAAGVSVRTAHVSGSPLAAHHAKYAIADGERLLVATENWGDSAYPAAGARGNRGWGVLLHDAGASRALAATFEEDFLLARDLEPSAAPALLVPPLAPQAPAGAHIPGPVNGTLLVAPLDPEALHALVARIAGARVSVDAALLSLSPRWSDGPSPLLGALLSAARNGARVRVLLEGGFEDGPGKNGNHAALAALQEAADRERLPLEVRFLSHPDVTTLHAKGAVVDGRATILGSLNWVEAAVRRNREVVVVLENEEAAAFFTRAFEGDWGGPAAPPPMQATPGAGAPALLLVALVVGWLPRKLQSGQPPCAGGAPAAPRVEPDGYHAVRPARQLPALPALPALPEGGGRSPRALRPAVREAQRPPAGARRARGGGRAPAAPRRGPLRGGPHERPRGGRGEGPRGLR